MENKPVYMLVTTILVVLALAAGLFGGIAIDRTLISSIAVAQAEPTSAGTSGPDFQLIGQAWDIIQKVYVDRAALVGKNLTYGAITGMVDALGDTGHSRFMTPEMVKAENNYTTGSFEGIGAEVEMKGDHVVIVAPIDGSPAQKAGLKPGDMIIKVNGQDMTGKSLNDVVSLILGPAGTKVTITIQHPDTNTTQDYTITRAKIVVNNVTWQMAPGTKIAVIRIAGFSQNVTDGLKTAINQAKQQGATGIVLDLRNNPGGLLDEAVGVTSQFVSSGDVLEEKDASGKITGVPVNKGGIGTDIPLVVLINEGSASASEIVAGAIQDSGRGKLVGAKTFGTGTVLRQYDLPDGSAMLLATQEWLTPKGRVIWHQGIMPDVPVNLPTNITPLTPEAANGMTPEQWKAYGDTQLIQAVQLLGGK